MANRRMFSKEITNSSAFMMLPLSSQALYFHLGMNADDDGFCEHFTVIRSCGSQPDDLKILEAKKFIKIFNDCVLIICGHCENNYIQSDRYKPSKYLPIYKAELDRLQIPYIVRQKNDTQSLYKKCIQDVSKMDTQDRLGKDRLGKEKDKEKEKNIPPLFPLIKKEKKKSACAINELPNLPDWLDKPIWEEWVIFRKEKKHSLTPSTIKKQLTFLEKHKENHIDIINRSITNGWIGLFPLKEENNKSIQQPIQEKPKSEIDIFKDLLPEFLDTKITDKKIHKSMFLKEFMEANFKKQQAMLRYIPDTVKEKIPFSILKRNETKINDVVDVVNSALRSP